MLLTSQHSQHLSIVFLPSCSLDSQAICSNHSTLLFSEECSLVVQDVNATSLWETILAACSDPAASNASSSGRSRRPSAAGDDLGATDALPDLGQDTSRVQGLRACTVGVGRSKLQLTLVPPPSNRADPLAIVELGKAAEVRRLVRRMTCT